MEITSNELKDNTIIVGALSVIMPSPPASTFACPLIFCLENPVLGASGDLAKKKVRRVGSTPPPYLKDEGERVGVGARGANLIPSFL